MGQESKSFQTEISMLALTRRVSLMGREDTIGPTVAITKVTFPTE